MVLARQCFRVIIAFKDHRGTVPTIVLDHVSHMYVSRRIEQDRVADAKPFLALLGDHTAHFEGGIVVGYEVERGDSSRWAGSAGVFTGSLGLGYLHLNQFASGPGGVLRQAFVVLWGMRN